MNVVLGLWSKPTHHRTSVETVTYSEDLQRSGPALKRAVDGHPTLFDYVFETELLTYVSMRPIHQICLDMEHVFLAKAYDTVRQFCEPRDISSFVTDALICHPSKTQRQRLEEAILSIKHPDDSNMFRVRETRGTVICMTEPPVTPDYNIEHNIPVWQDFVETDSQPAIDRARELVIGEGQSVFLQGFGGTGRTYAAKQIAKELLEQKKQIVCTAYTHMAAQNIAMPGAINGTLHHCLHKLPAFKGIAIIDEEMK